MSRLLAFDTSTDTMAIALVDGVREWCLDLPGGPRASASLLPALRGLLDDAGIEASALEAIGFGRGPGAFTGLRTACAVAQGFAFGLDVPVLPIDTLQIVAEDAASRAGTPVWWIATDARMSEAYAACYRRDGAGWQVVEAPALYTLPALRDRWTAQPPLAVAGSAVAAYAAELGLASVEGTLDAGAAPRATALARCLRESNRRGARVAADLALPLYLRDKVAFTTAEREAQRAAKVSA